MLGQGFAFRWYAATFLLARKNTLTASAPVQCPCAGAVLVGRLLQSLGTVSGHGATRWVIFTLTVTLLPSSVNGWPPTYLG